MTGGCVVPIGKGYAQMIQEIRDHNMGQKGYGGKKVENTVLYTLIDASKVGELTLEKSKEIKQ